MVGNMSREYGDNGQSRDDDGNEWQLSLSAALQELKELDEGTVIRIVYTGEETSSGGYQFKSFDLLAAETDSGENVEPFVAAQEDVPF